MESFRRIMDIVGTSMDGVGVLIVVGGSLFATVRLAFRRMQGAGNYYVWYRQDVGRAILLAELTYQCPLHCPYCSNPMPCTTRAAMSCSGVADSAHATEAA